jgi:ribosomal protein L2
VEAAAAAFSAGSLGRAKNQPNPENQGTGDPQAPQQSVVKFAKDQQQSATIMPTMLGVGYGTYQQRPENFLLSFVTHTAGIALMLWLLHIAVPAKIIPPTTANSVELAPYIPMKVGKGGQIARAAGTYVQLVGRDAGYAILRLNSGETRMVPAGCMATVGAVSNPDNSNVSIGKAGRMRWKGKKPVVRGVAMNPVDHPHGGGEGRTSGGRHPVTPWGKSTKGKKTRSNKASDKFILRSRHMKKKG